jgi:two-component system, NarL family, nitrate/nitrite response regulator NarL
VTTLEASLSEAFTEPFRVAIVDDHELLAESLMFALGGLGIDAVTVSPAVPEDALARLAEIRPRLVLLDLNLGDASALSLLGPVRELGANVLIVTGESSRVAWAECLEAGATGVISKATPFDELLERIKRCTNGEDPMSATERQGLLQSLQQHRSEERVRLEPFTRLTVRECEVLTELMAGLSAEAIATQAYVSLATVRSHIRSILLKLGVSSQLAAVAMASRSGWKSPYPQPQA